MAKQKEPLPNPLDDVLRTGSIGGNPKPETQEVTNTEKSTPTKIEEQHITNTDKPKYIKKEGHEAKQVERIKLGYSLRKDLIKDCRIIAAQTERKIYEVMEEALEEYIQKYKEGEK
jgi:hypothetical protein